MEHEIKNKQFSLKVSHLLMTMGLSPRLPCVMTLLMPFRATILAFMMGSVMESKSAEHKHRAHFLSKIFWRYSHMKPAGLTHVWDPRLWSGPLPDQGLHLFLLLLLLSFLIQEVLEEERLLLQEQRSVLVCALGGGPRVWGLGLGIK